MIDPVDLASIERQLGREPRGAMSVAHRCVCGEPDVVITNPRLPDGSPFPTLFYLTCPRACAAVGRLEANGVMRDMEGRLATDPDLRAGYAAAHESYLVQRTSAEDVPEISGISAGGMPDRVKCLHVLLAHALACGEGVNPLGDEVRALVGRWWEPTSCAESGPRPEGGRS